MLPNIKKLACAAATGAALSLVVAAPASAGELGTTDFAISDGNVEMVVFGSGYRVDKVRIHSVPELQGSAEYQFTYYATTGPNKSFKMICGGSGTGESCHHDFKINATYAKGVGIRSCGSIQRVDSGKNFGTPCKKW